MHTNALIVCLAVGAMGSSASADIAEASLSATGRGQNVRITMGDSSLNVFAGQLIHQVHDATGRAELLLGSITTYCTDLYDYASWQARLYELSALTAVPDSSPMSGRRAAALRDIYALADGSQLSPTASNEYAAAFQIAVWEIVSDYDGERESLDVAAGWFRASSTNGAALSAGVSTQVETFFNTVGSGVDFVGLVALRSATAQDQLAVIPAPGAGVALAAGLVLFRPRRR